MIEIASSLSIVEVTGRLQRLVGGESTVVSGRLVNSDLELVRTQRVGNSAFRPQFVGFVKQVAAGTVVIGDFNLSKRTKAFMRRWFLGVGVWVVCTLVVASTAHMPLLWLMPLAGAALFCLGAAFLRFARSYYRNDEDWLLTLLSDTLEAKGRVTASAPTVTK